MQNLIYAVIAIALLAACEHSPTCAEQKKRDWDRREITDSTNANRTKQDVSPDNENVEEDRQHDGDLDQTQDGSGD